MRGRAEETLLAEFALDRAGRQVGVRLARGLAFDVGDVDPFATNEISSGTSGVCLSAIAAT